MTRFELLVGDCRDVMANMADASVDSIVCDPPYGLSREPDAAEVLKHWLAGDDYTHSGKGFMSASWDSFVPGPSVWREALRVLKPGGHLVAFFGTRTYDLGTLAIRLAGFEIRDQLAWVFGSGFPKSHDVSKGIDKALGAEREVTGPNKFAHLNGKSNDVCYGAASRPDETAPATDAARQWQGWGTALKPAYEPIVLARKPFDRPTVAANVMAYGTGALNIDACRIGDEVTGWGGARGGSDDITQSKGRNYRLGEGDARPVTGRWPANFAHDGSDEVLAGFPVTGAGGTPHTRGKGGIGNDGHAGQSVADERVPTDSGSAARYFYCAKASRVDRDAGLDAQPLAPSAASQFRPNHTAGAEAGEPGNPYGRWAPRRNVHPTVKPTALMEWLCRMITPPGGIVFDPFLGSGSTGKAAMYEGFRFIGCDLSDEHVAIARARIEHAAGSQL